ncbi:twin-arginine translocation signal domain-containing protein [Cobetia marina]|uniref:twin-arginine translocation signal domain-containing protein n=1 Tax=Cobetia marina TaxID=28258 RepID=UPI0010AE9B50|nr:twin-arginine translocation signal domain-containing protein [Cobetia marina]TKD61630.1 twin-arginine translocation signal domain-containing protein [Cobetia marina]
MTDVVEKDLLESSEVQAVEKGSPSSRSRRGFLGMSGAAIAGAALGQFLPGTHSV